MTNEQIAEKILELLGERAPGLTICPSEVLMGELKQDKAKMEQVRTVARAMLRNRQIEILQRGRVLTEKELLRGPIRLRLWTGGL